MKKVMMIMVLGVLLACPIPANAQDLTQPRDPAIQSQKIMTTGAAYNGTVYEPFNNTTPADQSYSPAAAPGRPRRGYDANGQWTPDSEDFGGGAQYGGAEDQFPIGDAVLPLLLLALAYLSTRVFLKKRAIKG